jgi:uncharacterized GH25 family protein
MKLPCPRPTSLRYGLTIALVALSVVGCSLNVDVNDPVAIIKTTDQQTAPTNTQLPDPLSVLVTNQFGQPVPNVTVNWTIVSGGGTLSASSDLTDEGGVSSVTYTTGPTAGTVTIQAQTSGIPPVTFTVTVT